MEERRLTYAVRDISLTVEQGEFVFLIGSSGAGKTTLLQLMSGEIAPDEGTVLLNNTNIANFNLRPVFHHTIPSNSSSPF